MLEDIDHADGMVKELEARRTEKKKEVCEASNSTHCLPYYCHIAVLFQLNKSLRTAGVDVSAEIRSARKKSRDKVKNYPDSEAVDGDNEEIGTIQAPPAASAEPAGVATSGLCMI